MEYIHFEAQLCNEISMFEETSTFGCTDHPEKPAVVEESDYHINNHYQQYCVPAHL